MRTNPLNLGGSWFHGHAERTAGHRAHRRRNLLFFVLVATTAVMLIGRDRERQSTAPSPAPMTAPMTAVERPEAAPAAVPAEAPPPPEPEGPEPKTVLQASPMVVTVTVPARKSGSAASGETPARKVTAADASAP